MEFYEKLRKLRKENGMSQEEFASQLNVSRQAVSKWESGQGYPETDKLLLISSLFGVSLDYLLKEEEALCETDREPGYYASRETVEGYLLAKRRGARWIGAGVCILILGLVFPMLFDESRGIVLFMIFAGIGVGILVSRAFAPNRYEEMERQPLIFDPSFLREFKGEYQQQRKRYGALVVTGVLLCILSLLILFWENEQLVDRAIALMPILWAVAVYLFIIAGSALSSLTVVADNESHMREVEQEKRSGWLFGMVMPLTSMLYLVLGFVWNAWLPGWIVFPVAALICAGITGGMNANR